MADLGPSERAYVRGLINGWKQRAEAAEAERDALRAAVRRVETVIRKWDSTPLPADSSHEFIADIAVNYDGEEPIRLDECCIVLSRDPFRRCDQREDHPVHNYQRGDDNDAS